MDALLSELFRKQPPRDFSGEILAKLSQPQPEHPSAPVRPRPIKRLAGRPPFFKRTDVRIFFAVAASLTAVMLFRGFQGPIRLSRLGTNNTDSASETLRKDGAAMAQGNGATIVRPIPQAGDLAGAAKKPGGNALPGENKPPRRDPIVLRLESTDSSGTVDPLNPVGEMDDEMIAAGLNAAGESDNDGLGQRPKFAALSGPTLGDFDQQFVSYWSGIGVSPAPVVDPAAWANRIADRFGIQVSEQSGGQASIGHDFADESACRALAERLVAQLSEGLNLDGETVERLVNEATTVIFRGDRIDRWLADWIVASQPGAGAVARVDHASQMGEWVAGQVLGADIGCARCHDSPIDGRYSQQDYWAMSSLFVPPGDSPLFYELLDGRQRVATAGVPARWLGVTAGNDDNAPTVTAERLGERVIGNRQVAKTLANHLWTIGFGSPLVAAASSPIAPPRDDAIERALEMLSDRLIANDFDIRAAADWVIHCDPMRRGTPIEWRDPSWQFASEASLAKASLAQRSFAAARAPWPKASEGQLLAMMGSRTNLVPGRIEVRDALLAQPIGIPADRTQSSDASSPPPPSTNTVKAEDHWWAQWLADREALRGGWMESLRNPKQQVRHAFYAAGHRSVSEEQMRWTDEVLETVKDSPAGRSDAIATIYWIIQNAE
jgi:hypothetical protein